MAQCVIVSFCANLTTNQIEIKFNASNPNNLYNNGQRLGTLHYLLIITMGLNFLQQHQVEVSCQPY